MILVCYENWNPGIFQYHIREIECYRFFKQTKVASCLVCIWWHGCKSEHIRLGLMITSYRLLWCIISYLCPRYFLFRSCHFSNAHVILLHNSDVIWVTSWLKSLITWLFVQQLKGNNKLNIEAMLFKPDRGQSLKAQQTFPVRASRSYISVTSYNVLYWCWFIGDKISVYLSALS